MSEAEHTLVERSSPYTRIPLDHKFSQAQPVERVNPRVSQLWSLGPGTRSSSFVPQSEEAMRQEEEELQRALEESAKLADPKRGFVASQPHKALPEHPNLHSSQSHDQGFAPPQRDSSINRDERTPKRVRAIYDFDGGQGPDELPFRKGDIIRVTECVYTDWWKGELRGRTGIFPANRVVSSANEDGGASRAVPYFSYAYTNAGSCS